MAPQMSESSDSPAAVDQLQTGLRVAPDQFAAILACIAEGVTVQDASGRLVYANDAAARLSGFESGEELVAGSPADTLRRFKLLDQDGQPFLPERLPGRLVLRGENAPETIVRFRPSGGGKDQWALINSTPVLDADGRVQFAVNVFRDITERKRAEDASRFLADASGVLAESLDYEVTLERVAHLAVPSLADWCVVDIVEKHQVRRLAVAHTDPARVELARQLQERYPEEPDAPNGVWAVLRNGKSEMLSEISDAMLVAGARDEEHLRLLRALELRSYLIVPLLARGHTLGAITFVAAESGRQYEAWDLVIAEELAGRAALALDNARLYRESQEQAETHVLLNAALREAVGERDEAVARLEESLRTRDEFLAAAAHDLKNPLAAIKAQAQLIGRQAQAGRTPDPGRLVSITQSIDTLVSRADAQVEELLDLAGLEMGRPPRLDLGPTDIVPLIQGVIGEYRHLASDHVLEVESSEPNLEGHWDARRLTRAISNLIDNAIKYSPDGGPIRVRIQRTGEASQKLAIISVQDPGMGIPAEDQPHVFDRFRRGSNVLNRVPGTGIGLASVRWIVESHGGSIEVDSQIGRGSIFTMRLPVNIPVPAPNQLTRPVADVA
jgi:PAS domain S-box-containing protein